MSQGNLALVEEAVAAFNRRDLDWLYEQMPDDFEFVSVFDGGRRRSDLSRLPAVMRNGLPGVLRRAR